MVVLQASRPDTGGPFPCPRAGWDGIPNGRPGGNEGRQNSKEGEKEKMQSPKTIKRKNKATIRVRVLRRHRHENLSVVAYLRFYPSPGGIFFDTRCCVGNVFDFFFLRIWLCVKCSHVLVGGYPPEGGNDGWVPRVPRWGSWAIHLVVSTTIGRWVGDAEKKKSKTRKKKIINKTKQN